MVKSRNCSITLNFYVPSEMEKSLSKSLRLTTWSPFMLNYLIERNNEPIYIFWEEVKVHL